MLPDSADEALVSDDSLAYIKITSVKPVSYWLHNLPLSSVARLGQNHGWRESLNLRIPRPGSSEERKKRLTAGERGENLDPIHGGVWLGVRVPGGSTLRAKPKV